MKYFEDSLEIINTNRDHAYSLIRIFLGIALFVRGLILLTDASVIANLAGGQDLYWWHSLIMASHLVGGILLTLGYLTRLAAFIQLPILVGAVFIFHLNEGLGRAGQALELSVLVMFLLFIFLLYGAGLFSLDNFSAKKKSSS